MWRLGFRRPSNSEQQEQKDIDKVIQLTEADRLSRVSALAILSFNDDNNNDNNNNNIFAVIRQKKQATNRYHE